MDESSKIQVPPRRKPRALENRTQRGRGNWMGQRWQGGPRAEFRPWRSSRVQRFQAKRGWLSKSRSFYAIVKIKHLEVVIKLCFIYSFGSKYCLIFLLLCPLFKWLLVTEVCVNFFSKKKRKKAGAIWWSHLWTSFPSPVNRKAFGLQGKEALYPSTYMITSTENVRRHKELRNFPKTLLLSLALWAPLSLVQMVIFVRVCRQFIQ